MTISKVFAPAKINLTLHVTGQRKDGYHLLDSLVMFADIGDRITLSPAAETSLEVIGPMAGGVPSDKSNLVLRAAALFDVSVAITLSKHLPMAAGIGGGSSDAAATALALCDLLETRDLPVGLADLGADIRVCLTRRAARMQGIGEQITPLPNLPPLFAVLANPGVGMATPDVFKALENKQGKPMPARLPNMNTAGFIKWLSKQRNDLEQTARKLEPAIGETLTALAGLKDAKLTRMSGSGATCFALFETRAQADQGAQSLHKTHPDWWVHPVTLG